MQVASSCFLYAVSRLSPSPGVHFLHLQFRFQNYQVVLGHITDLDCQRNKMPRCTSRYMPRTGGARRACHPPGYSLQLVYTRPHRPSGSPTKARKPVRTLLKLQQSVDTTSNSKCFVPGKRACSSKGVLPIATGF